MPGMVANTPSPPPRRGVPAGLLTAVFGLILWRWRFVSLGSICAAAVMPPLVLFLDGRQPVVAMTLLIALLVIWKHRENITRLRTGTENRFKA